MKTMLKLSLLLLSSVPLGVAYPQEPQKVDDPLVLDAPKTTTVEPPIQSSSESTLTAQVHFLELRHAEAKDLSESLQKLFDENIKSGQLVILSDARANRLIVKSDDRVYLEVRKLVAELDVAGSARSAPVPVQPSTSYSSPGAYAAHESQRRIIKAIKESANDPAKSQFLREELLEAVQTDFAEQQRQLRSDLVQLRAKMDSLQALLEKREAQKSAICLKRVEAILAAPADAGQSKSDPAFKRSREAASLHTNANLDAVTFPPEINTILQGELSGEDGIQVRLDGELYSLSRDLPFQITNLDNPIELEVTSRNGNLATLRIKMECAQASEDFWKRIRFETVRLKVTQADVDIAASNQMVVKCLYLAKEPGKGLGWSQASQIEPGLDIREKSKEFGDPILTMTLTRPEPTKGWQHSYGTNEQVQAYFVALANYSRLIHSADAHDSQLKDALDSLINNASSGEELRKEAAPRKAELDKHIAALKAIPSGFVAVPRELNYLTEGLSILARKGRVELEKWLANRPDQNPLNSKSSSTRLKE